MAPVGWKSALLAFTSEAMVAESSIIERFDLGARNWLSFARA
jgi:hypothetical protein